MQGRDFALIVLLAAYALFIWFRDTAWFSTAGDTLPILISIPLFFWLGSPWNFRKEPYPISATLLIIATLLFLLGIVFNLTFVLAGSFTLLLFAFLSRWNDDIRTTNKKKLLVLPMMAFPWIALDANTIGWWFRLSGAWVTGKFFALFGKEVVQQGTSVIVDGVPLSVEAACAGLNTLQSLLIAGTVAAYILFKDTPKFWWNIPVLVLIAWLSNILRIIGISSAALLVSPEFALGPFHTWGGWLILMVMFALCWFIFSLQASKPISKP